MIGTCRQSSDNEQSDLENEQSDVLEMCKAMMRNVRRLSSRHIFRMAAGPWSEEPGQSTLKMSSLPSSQNSSLPTLGSVELKSGKTMENLLKDLPEGREGQTSLPHCFGGSTPAIPKTPAIHGGH